MLQLILHKVCRYRWLISWVFRIWNKKIRSDNWCLSNISNPVTLYCLAPGGAGAAGVQQPASAPPCGLQSLAQVAEPADLAKVERSQPGHPVGVRDGQVSRREVWKTQIHHLNKRCMHPYYYFVTKYSGDTVSLLFISSNFMTPLKNDTHKMHLPSQNK